MGIVIARSRYLGAGFRDVRLIIGWYYRCKAPSPVITLFINDLYYRGVITTGVQRSDTITPAGRAGNLVKFPSTVIR